MNHRYSIGVDFGTLSCRALLVDCSSGEVCGTGDARYRHGVIDRSLPGTDIELPTDWALQHPLDYIGALTEAVPEALREANIDSSRVIGMSVDFTSCTLVALSGRPLEPLCLRPGFESVPHAWPKLWKHHAAAGQAEELTHSARIEGAQFLRRCGGRISSEWYYPKIMQVIDEAPAVFEAVDTFLEAGDWIVYELTGEVTRNSCCASYKAHWDPRDKFPDATFLSKVRPELGELAVAKTLGDVVPIGSAAGGLRKKYAKTLGLREGLPIGVSNTDAHLVVPALGASQPGKLCLVVGTSLCHMTTAHQERHIEGLCGVVRDGIVPELFGYEAGQPAVGDMLDWLCRFLKCPNERNGVSYLDRLGELEESALRITPGSTGLVVLDWMNGNRSLLNETRLSGVVLGLNLQTTPEQLYLALLESVAFGTRRVVEALHHSGLRIEEVFACGGLAHRSPLLMQVFADVLGRPVYVPDLANAPAFGAAMYGAVAAGPAKGGFHSIIEAEQLLTKRGHSTYAPRPDAVSCYDRLDELYQTVHDLYGHQYRHTLLDLRGYRS